MGVQPDRVEGDAEICEDAKPDQSCRRHILGQAAEDKGTGERYDLGQKERQQEAGSVKPQRSPICGSHIDNRIYAVDIEEERQQEEKDLLLLVYLLQRCAKAGEAVADYMLSGVGIVDLLIILKKRQGCHKPPEGGDKKCDQHGCLHGKPERLRVQHDDKAEDERDAASNVPPRIPVGRYHIHTFLYGHVGQHGVIEDQAYRVSSLCDHEDYKEHKP